MTTTFMSPALDHNDKTELLNGGIRFADSPGLVPVGIGEEVDSMAAPFARFAAKTSFPVTGKGAEITASFATDTATRSGGRSDDTRLDDM